MSRGLTMSGISVCTNGIYNTMTGNQFFSDWKSSAISGFISGGIEGFMIANETGKNLWWGNDIAYNRRKWSFFNIDKSEQTLWVGIPSNVGSDAANNCVPKSFAEIERYYGGERTYDEFCSIVKYINNDGTALNVTQFNDLVSNNFNNSCLFKKEYMLFDPAFFSESIQKNETYIFLFRDGNERHADVLRGLKVFEKSPQKNMLLFRESKFNYILSTPNRPLSIIKIWMP